MLWWDLKRAMDKYWNNTVKKIGPQICDKPTSASHQAPLISLHSSPNLLHPPHQTSKRWPPSVPTPTRQRQAQLGQNSHRPRLMPTHDHITGRKLGSHHQRLFGSDLRHPPWDEGRQKLSQNGEEQSQYADPRTEEGLEDKKDTYTVSTMDGRTLSLN